MNISRPGRIALSTLSLTLLTAPAFAQEGTGLQGSLSFNQRFDYSDNPDLALFPGDPKIKSRSSLRFDLDSETRSERFNLNVGGEFVGAFGDGATDADDLEFRNESAGISYSRSGSDARFSLGASYRRADLTDDVFGFFVDGVFDPDALIIDGGTRTRTDLSGSIETGLDAPFGIEISAFASDRDYQDTTDPELNDQTRREVDATARFRVNPAVTARLLAGLSVSETDDATDTERTNTYVGVGVEGETGGGLSYTGDLTLDNSERSELGVQVSDDQGIGFSISATQEQPDGAFGVRLSSRIDDSGRRTSASVSRDFDLPNGALSLSLGITDQEDGSSELTTRLTYLRDLPDGQFSADIVQQPTTEDGTAFLNTSVNLNYRQSINSISSWDAGFSYGATDEFGSSDGDTRTSASIAYNRELTEDWNLRAGLSATRIDSDGGSDRSRESVFLSVGRDFTFGF